jgi:hypothetical protein
MKNFVENQFPALVKQLVTEALGLSLLNADAFNGFASHLRRLELATLVVPVRWSKFPYVRHPLALDREQLLADHDQREQVIKVVADNLYHLLLRDLRPALVPVLNGLTAEMLVECVSTLWINKLTAPVVSEMILLRAIKTADSERWSQLQAVIDSVGKKA